jgi:hypothetical protein
MQLGASAVHATTINDGHYYRHRHNGYNNYNYRYCFACLQSPRDLLWSAYRSFRQLSRLPGCN